MSLSRPSYLRIFVKHFHQQGERIVGVGAGSRVGRIARDIAGTRDADQVRSGIDLQQTRSARIPIAGAILSLVKPLALMDEALVEREEPERANAPLAAECADPLPCAGFGFSTMP